MIKVDNILFDFNGTIVDDLDLCIELLNTMLVYCHHQPVTKESYLEIFDFPVIEYYKKAGFVFPKDDFDSLAKFFIKEYTTNNVKCPLYDGVKELLAYYKKMGKHLYIVSASEINLLKNQLKHLGVDQYFEGISGLDNINAGGKIESAQRFISSKNLDLSKTVFVGDTIHDKEVADALHVQSVLVSKGHQSKKRLENHCPIVIEDISLLKDIIV